ncbi:basic amino acid ABC transporter substrate-binding protein [Arthrobacter sp. NPDC089319]|uniref:basic amino acid ABC transporter substrate-binding protein n=1 Tax=Arthrobacter sp. NPDC089319 TaxID=3155915 RepID=UPI00343B6805
MRKKASKAVQGLSLLAVAALALTACGGSDNAGGNGGTGSASGAASDLPLVQAGTLTVCSDIPYPPFEFEEGGKYTGFDIDLITDIASEMGLEVSVQDVGFDALQSGVTLAAGQCDLGASAMTITEDRKKNIAFSDPYYDSLQSLLVPEGSDIKSIDDLAGKKVGVQQGTTGESYTRENAPSDAEIVAFPSDAEMYQAIQAGQVDALLQDLPVNIGHTKDGKFTLVQEYKTDETYGFAAKKEGSEALISAVNDALTTLRDNGKYQEIYDKYFTE